MKTFNDMTDNEISAMLKEFSDKYGITYNMVGYHKEHFDNTILVVLNYSCDYAGDMREIEDILSYILVGLTDIDGNDIEPDNDMLEDKGLMINVMDTRDSELIELCIASMKKHGDITWLKVA